MLLFEAFDVPVIQFFFYSPAFVYKAMYCWIFFLPSYLLGSHLCVCFNSLILLSIFTWWPRISVSSFVICHAFEPCALLIPSLQFKISLSWSLGTNNLASVFRWAPALLYKYLYSRNTLVPDESDLLLCHHPVNCAFRFSFASSFQKPIFCCQDVCLSFSSYHNIGFSSAFPRNQSRLCDLCSWWANHHVVFCQIPDSSCLFTWWYSNTPFLVFIKTASFMHQQGEGICQKRVTLVTETSNCLWNGGEGNGSAGEGKKCRSGVTVLTLGVSKK